MRFYIKLFNKSIVSDFQVEPSDGLFLYSVNNDPDFDWNSVNDPKPENFSMVVYTVNLPLHINLVRSRVIVMKFVV